MRRPWMQACGGPGCQRAEAPAASLLRPWLAARRGPGWQHAEALSGSMRRPWLASCGGPGWQHVEALAASMRRPWLAACGGPGCQLKKLVVGPWVGSVGPPHGVHCPPHPLCRRCVPVLNWPGHASGTVTLKKLECLKKAHALDSLAWDNTTGFRSNCVGLRDRSND
ncbi:hypothetical protein MA16_Dca022656 [Dendrobium catenatum]|uniref:Uncharacterized protein n=1 Tax=Dendrobium catenatum TaxID=906689 RepID=A0A2I0VC67_9ASPA|nr:hypothetical protein MA16_Dca022656 [Dendrobium catenatum]